MTITVNGSERQFDASLTGAALLEHLGIPPGTLVAELNGRIVPREEFLQRELVDGDVLELVTLVGGGL